MKKLNYQLWFSCLLIILLLLGIYFRCFNVTTKVFWHDEIYTRFHIAAYQSREWISQLFNNQIITVADIQKYQYLNPEKGLKDVLNVLAVDDPHHPPLYYIIVRFWLQFFGDSVAVLRSFSVVMSLFALPAIYGLSLELFAVSSVGLWVIALLSISPFFVLYAQEAREYAFWTVIIILSNWTLLRAIRISEQGVIEKKFYITWLLYGLSLIVGFYISLFTILMVIAHGFYVIIRTSFRINKIWFSYVITIIVSLVAFLPWILVFIANYEQYKRATAWASLIKIPLLDILKYLALNISRVFADFSGEFANPLNWLMMLLFVALFIYTGYILCINTPVRIWGFIFSLVLIPILLLIIPDLVWGGVRSLSSRYLIPSWIGIILGVAYLLANQFHQKRQLMVIIAVFVISIGVISNTINSQSNTSWTKVISYSLPAVATIINQTDYPLLVGNNIGYNTGNIIALSYLLNPQVKVRLLPTETGYTIPQQFTDIFFLTPSEQLPAELAQQQRVKLELVFADNHLCLWKIKYP